MMTKRLIGPALLAIFACALAATHAAAATAKASPLDRYERTGQFESCIRTRFIRASTILNDHQILFEMANGGAYLAEPKQCSGLSPMLGLAYDASTGELCNTSIIYLVDMTSPMPKRGTCNIERFEKLKKKPSQKPKAPAPSTP